jgi:hypothetical protein
MLSIISPIVDITGDLPFCLLAKGQIFSIVSMIGKNLECSYRKGHTRSHSEYGS